MDCLINKEEWSDGARFNAGRDEYSYDDFTWDFAVEQWKPYSDARSVKATTRPASSGSATKPLWRCISPLMSRAAGRA